MKLLRMLSSMVWLPPILLLCAACAGGEETVTLPAEEPPAAVLLPETEWAEPDLSALAQPPASDGG